MKSRLLLTVSLCALSSFSFLANASTSCDTTAKDINLANNTVALLDSYSGPVKSVVMTSTLPNDGRFKAIKNEIRFDECGALTKYHASLQEYIQGYVESIIIRMPENKPYDFKFKAQLRNRYFAHTIYTHEVFSKNTQNFLDKKETSFYGEDGALIGKDISQFTIKDNRIVLETTKSANPDDVGQRTTAYEYDAQGRLLKTLENNVVTLDFKYDENGKILQQIQLINGLNGELKTYDFTCSEWDKYNNCLTWHLASKVEFNNETINFSKATLHNQFEYFE